MIAIQAGPAILGSTSAERAQARRDLGTGDATLFEDEQPRRTVELPAFRIDPTPVTNDAFAEFVEACGVAAPNADAISPATWQAQAKKYALTVDYAAVEGFLWNGQLPVAERARHPVVLIDHDQAAFYCAWRGARLPTAEEWERAARGPGGRPYPWGERYDPFRVHSAVRGVGDTVEVGALPQGASPEGVLDMGGHVFEWTSSVGGRGKGLFLVKGNGFGMPGGYGRGAAALARPADLRHIRVGFRCAADR